MISSMKKKARKRFSVIIIRLMRPICHTGCGVRVVISLVFNTTAIRLTQIIIHQQHTLTIKISISTPRTLPGEERERDGEQEQC